MWVKKQLSETYPLEHLNVSDVRALLRNVTCPIP